MTSTSAGEATEALGRALRRGVRTALLLVVVACIALAAVAVAVDGVPGLWGAVVGTAVAAGFLLVTTVVGLATVGRDPLVMATALLGSWLVKAVVAIGALFAVRAADGIEDLWVGVGILVGVVATLTAQSRALLTARVPYIDTTSRRDENSGPTSSH